MKESLSRPKPGLMLREDRVRMGVVAVWSAAGTLDTRMRAPHLLEKT